MISEKRAPQPTLKTLKTLTVPEFAGAIGKKVGRFAIRQSGNAGGGYDYPTRPSDDGPAAETVID
jgi:hypothetical protein